MRELHSLKNDPKQIEEQIQQLDYLGNRFTHHEHNFDKTTTTEKQGKSDAKAKLRKRQLLQMRETLVPKVTRM